MMASVSDYTYSSLQPDPKKADHVADSRPRFRLLILNPGQHFDELTCSLQICDLAAAPDFEAISYAWGDYTDTCDILCLGRRLQITRSLASPLRRFRLPIEQRVLWADAICIDQKNIQERKPK